MKKLFALIFFLSTGILCAFGQEQIAKNNTEEKSAEKAAAEKTVPEEEGPEKYVPAPMNLSQQGSDSMNTVPLSLNEAIKRALENNNDIEVARNNVKISEFRIRSLNGNYDPVFTMSPTFSRSSSTGTSASNDFRFNSDMAKQLKRGGANYDVFFNTSQTGRNSSNNTAFNQTSSLGGSSSSTYVTSLGFRFTQPLFRGRRIDQTRSQIRIQKKRLQQSDLDFRLQTIGVISQVQEAYWDLVFALRDQQNRVANLNLSKENLRIVEARITAGTAAPLQRAEVGTELANRETEVILATEQVSLAQNRLKTLLLKDLGASEWGSQFVPTDQPVFSDEPIKLDDAVKDAVDNRQELRRLKLEREINEENIRLARDQVKPKIDFVSSFSLQGISLGNVNTNATQSRFIPFDAASIQNNPSSYLYSLICPANIATANPAGCANNPIISIPGSPGFFNGGYGRSFANLFRSDAPNYSFGVSISFPLKNQTAKAELAIAQIEKTQIDVRTRSQEQAVIAEVRNAVNAVETARQRVLASRRARENAEIQLKGEQKLYEAGRSTTFLLFQRENALTNARNSEIRAETDYNKAAAALQRVTSSTFRVNNIEVESPVEIK